MTIPSFFTLRSRRISRMPLFFLQSTYLDSLYTFHNSFSLAVPGVPGGEHEPAHRGHVQQQVRTQPEPLLQQPQRPLPGMLSWRLFMICTCFVCFGGHVHEELCLFSCVPSVFHTILTRHLCTTSSFLTDVRHGGHEPGLDQQHGSPHHEQQQLQPAAAPRADQRGGRRAARGGDADHVGH